MFVDSHCHINFPELAEKLPEILGHMAENQVSHALCIGVELEKFPEIRALAEAHPNVYASVGVHPDHEHCTEPGVDELVKLAGHPKVVAIGETEQHLAELIRPALARGAWVVSDRFTDASYAYQCGGRGIPVERVAALEAWVQRGFAPALTLLFDVPPEIAEARRAAVRTADRFEREADSFFTRVRNAYLDRARAEPARVRVLDARQSIAELQAEIGALLEGLG